MILIQVQTLPRRAEIAYRESLIIGVLGSENPEWAGCLSSQRNAKRNGLPTAQWCILSKSQFGRTEETTDAL